MEQNTEKVPVRDDGQLRDAIDSIAVIRSVIDRASVNMRSLAPLLIAMGGSQILLTLLRMVFLPIATRYVDIAGMTKISTVFVIAGYALAVALFVLFICMRRRFMRTENTYTMKLYDMWGTVMFVVYPLSLLVSVTVSHIVSRTGSDTAMLAYPMVEVVSFAAVCMCLYFTGLLGDKLWLKILAGVLILGFVMLYCSDLSWLFGTTHSITNALSAYSYMAVRGSTAGIIANAVYLILGICFIIKRGGNGNGNN